MKDNQKEHGRGLNRSKRPSDRINPSANLPKSVYIQLRPDCIGRGLRRTLRSLAAVCCPSAVDDDWQVWRIPMQSQTFGQLEDALHRAGYHGVIARHAGRIGMVASGTGEAKQGLGAKLRNQLYRELVKSGNVPMLLYSLFGDSSCLSWKDESTVMADWPDREDNLELWPDGKLRPVDAQKARWPTEYEARKRFPWIGRLWNGAQRIIGAELTEMRRRMKSEGTDEDTITLSLELHRRKRESIILAWWTQVTQAPIAGTGRQGKGALGSETERESLKQARLDSDHTSRAAYLPVIVSPE